MKTLTTFLFLCLGHHALEGVILHFPSVHLCSVPFLWTLMGYLVCTAVFIITNCCICKSSAAHFAQHLKVWFNKELYYHIADFCQQLFSLES